MRQYDILTLFPDMVLNGLNTSVVGRAIARGILQVNAVNIRDHADNQYGSVDDYPYGGGAGMVLQAEPVYRAYRAVREGAGDCPVIYLSPQGRTFCQELAQELAREERLIFLCGHYEGVDQRVLDRIVTQEVSIGDYVLTGGELAAMVVIDAISRLIPGVLHNAESANCETFHNNLLEYPQYSRPQLWEGEAVPDILLSGHHKNVEQWRREQSLIRTLEKRPDLLEGADLTEKEKKFLEQYQKEHI